MVSIKLSYDGPEAESIQQRSAQRWRAAVSEANAASRYRVSPLDLRGLLSRIPSIPDRLPSEYRFIQGSSTWRKADDCALLGKREPFQDVGLTGFHPVICKISKSGNFQKWEDSPNNGLALMILGWAYILSASLAERQGLALQYQFSSERPASESPESEDHASDTKQLRIEYATCHERTWWKSLISQGVGWKIEDRVSPWGVSIDDFDLEVVGQVEQGGTPPTARQAASYLGRLCLAFDLGNQSSAGLAAALSLPLHALQKLRDSSKIELPVPAMNQAVNTPEKDCLPPEFPLLGYYMTLSLSEWAFGPTLWSVFWEPHITCNFAGAWLRPIAVVLKPILSNNNLELLAKVFASTKVAPLWVGVALCGRGTIINRILPYLNNINNHPFTLPSIDAAAWTGVPQSFLDDPRIEPCLDGTISRADVWRLRHDFRSRYENSAFRRIPDHGFPPFGRMKEDDVELEIRGHIYCSHHWEYAHWTWRPDLGTDTGFNKDDKAVEIPPAPSTEIQVGHREAKNLNNRKVSKLATKLMFWWSSTQVEKGFGGTVVERYREHDPPTLSAGSTVSAPDEEKRARISKWLSAVVQETSRDEISSDSSSGDEITSDSSSGEDV